MKRLILLSLIAAATTLGLAAPAHATPHCQKCPYSCSDLGLGKKDCSQLSESRGLCCVDLTQKGLELAKEQERALANSQAQRVSCPPGFKPSERSCSPDERKRGCRDMRVGPNNMGCVVARFR
jgi:hypothetical protein